MTKHILITGASSGLGRALAVRYADKGVTLSLSGRSQERLEETAQLCRDKGSDVYTKVIDVTDREAMEAWVIGANDTYPLSVVIANAGVSAGTAGGGESLEQVQEILDINVGGILYTLHPAMECMKKHKGGQLVIISSLASFRGMPSCPAYSMSKGAARMYGEALRGVLSADNIGVTVVTPGYIDTPMTAVNKFPMPFLQKADRAADYIVRKLQKNPSRIAFPKLMYSVVSFLGALPPWLTDGLYRALPGKGSKVKQ